MSSQTYVFTDDPNDPCAYCVQWEEGDDPMQDEARPYLPSGYVDRVYRFTHKECTDSVMRYVAEAGADR